MAVAETGSGGDTTAPSAIATDHGMAGTSQRATTATATIVSATATSTSPVTGTQFSRRSRGDASKAASRITGATKSVRASSGSRLMPGTLMGEIARAVPARASSTG